VAGKFIPSVYKGAQKSLASQFPVTKGRFSPQISFICLHIVKNGYRLLSSPKSLISLPQLVGFYSQARNSTAMNGPKPALII
jgi:hypothetical protein